MKVLDLACNHPSCEGKGEYCLPGSCHNCGVEFTVRITKGHERPSSSFKAETCPECGCKSVTCPMPTNAASTRVQGK